MALQAVVVGGGIGGIAAAVALTQAGIDVQVHEQARQLAEVGAGVSLAPNGLLMLERLGVGDGIRRLGVRYAASQLRLPDGRPVEHEPYQFAVAGQNIGIHRADLLALLAGQLPPGTVRTGHRCTDFRQDDASDNGSETPAKRERHGRLRRREHRHGRRGDRRGRHPLGPAGLRGRPGRARVLRRGGLPGPGAVPAASTRPARSGCGWARGGISWCSRCGPGSC